MIDAGIFTIVAPNWQSCAQCPVLKNNYPKLYDMSYLTPKLNQPIFFSHSSKGKNPLISNGWQPFAEDWGVWSDGKLAQLILPAPVNQQKKIELNLRAFIVGKEAYLPISIQLNAGPIAQLELKHFENNRVVLDLPDDSPQNQYLLVKFSIESPKKPKDYGLNLDDRLIGIGLKSIQYLP